MAIVHLSVLDSHMLQILSGELSYMCRNVLHLSGKDCHAVTGPCREQFPRLGGNNKSVGFRAFPLTYYTRSFSKESWLLIKAEIEVLFWLSVVTGVELLLGNLWNQREQLPVTRYSIEGCLCSSTLVSKAVVITVPLESPFFCLPFLWGAGYYLSGKCKVKVISLAYSHLCNHLPQGLLDCFYLIYTTTP